MLMKMLPSIDRYVWKGSLQNEPANETMVLIT